VHAAGLHVGDILQTDQSSVHRFSEDTGSYSRTTVDLAMDTTRRPGVTGETGFLVTNVPPDSLAAKAELQPGDFIARIDEHPVQSIADLALVRRACEARVPVSIYVIRWVPEQRSFMYAVSRHTFHATSAQPD
jgi:S1-C subfamily serine protease